MNLLSLLLIDSSYPINTRNKRIIQTLCQGNFTDINYVAWNRDGRDLMTVDNEMIIYCAKAAYGNPFSKVMRLVGYYSFLKKCNNQKRPKVIIASHWDMLFLAALMKQKGQYLIYENLDIPTASNIVLRKVFERIERWALKKTDTIIFASRFFKPLYTSFSGRMFVLENKPLQVYPLSVTKKDSNKLVISYIGLIRYVDILKRLVDAIGGRENVCLYLHGEGQDLMELKNYAHNYSNVIFTGRYEPEQLSQLYAESDLVWAAYPNKDYNVKYAISNKFHESIAYHVPCIYAKNTLLGDLVKEKNLGYIVDPYDITDINKIIDYTLLYKSDIIEKKHALELYEKQEDNWSVQFQPIINYLNTLK